MDVCFPLRTVYGLCHRFHPYHQIRLDMGISDWQNILPSQPDYETNSESNNIFCGDIHAIKHVFREREGGKKDFVHSLHWRYWKKRAFYAMMEAPKNLLHKIEWFTLIPNLMTMINLPCSLHPPPGARYIWTVNLWLG